VFVIYGFDLFEVMVILLFVGLVVLAGFLCCLCGWFDVDWDFVV